MTNETIAYFDRIKSVSDKGPNESPLLCLQIEIYAKLIKKIYEYSIFIILLISIIKKQLNEKN